MYRARRWKEASLYRESLPCSPRPQILDQRWTLCRWDDFSQESGLRSRDSCWSLAAARLIVVHLDNRKRATGAHLVTQRRKGSLQRKLRRRQPGREEGRQGAFWNQIPFSAHHFQETPLCLCYQLPPPLPHLGLNCFVSVVCKTKQNTKDKTKQTKSKTIDAFTPWWFFEM